MKKTNLIIYKVVTGAALISIAIVIKLFINFETPVFRLSIFEFPLMLGSILLGPIYGAMAGFITDVNYIIMNPRAMIVGLNWFTLESVAYGLVPGLYFTFTRYSKKKLYFIVLVTMLLGLTFNTLGIRQYYSTATALSGLPFRLLRDIIKYPINVFLVNLLLTDRRFKAFYIFKQFNQEHQIEIDINDDIINP